MRNLRYLSFARLLEARDDIASDEPVPHQGRILWRWPHCDFVVVDDVDVALGARVGARMGQKRSARTEGQHVVAALQGALSADEQRALGGARTVWVICDDDDEQNWLDTLGAHLLSISPPSASGPAEVMVVRLNPGRTTFHPKSCFK